MRPRGRPIETKGNIRAAFPAFLLSATPVASGSDWSLRLSNDRPAYHCPRCSENAMQFFRRHPAHPHRDDFYLCQACGGSWEL